MGTKNEQLKTPLPKRKFPQTELFRFDLVTVSLIIGLTGIALIATNKQLTVFFSLFSVVQR